MAAALLRLAACATLARALFVHPGAGNTATLKPPVIDPFNPFGAPALSPSPTATSTKSVPAPAAAIAGAMFDPFSGQSLPASAPAAAPAPVPAAASSSSGSLPSAKGSVADYESTHGDDL